MVSRAELRDSLRLARRISDTLGLQETFLDVRDISIDFIESILLKLFGYYPDRSTELSNRYDACLRHITMFTKVQMPHITGHQLENYDSLSWYNLLEILYFLTDYSFRVGQTSPYIRGVEKSRCDMQGDNYHDSGECWSDLVTFDSAVFSEDSLTPPVRAPHEKDYKASTNHLHRLDPDVLTLDENRERLNYLKNKLLECLHGTEVVDISLSANETDTCDSKIPRISRPTSTPAKTQRVALPHKPQRSEGFVKPCSHPLVNLKRVLNAKSAAESRPAKAKGDHIDGLLEEVLEAFPTLTLDRHEERVLRKKAANALGECASAISNGHCHLSWIEERQKRRFAQLLRHELRADRILSRRMDAEATERVLRAKMREQRRQLIRARNHYRQFVQEFRARKVANIINEEKVFRHFFENLVKQEREQLREFQRIERDKRHANEDMMSRIAKCDDKNAKSRGPRENPAIKWLHNERLELKNREHELRSKLEENIRRMQQIVIDNTDTEYFRSKDADRLLRHSYTLAK